jgi:hypothetical protein
MSMGGLFAGIVAGAFGMAYIVYGKRQGKLAPVIAGLLLCIYPYFIDSLLWLAVIGAALLLAPFVVEF